MTCKVVKNVEKGTLVTTICGAIDVVCLLYELLRILIMVLTGPPKLKSPKTFCCLVGMLSQVNPWELAV